VGYLRPIKQWNPGKQAEFNMRKTYKSLDQIINTESEAASSGEVPDPAPSYDDSVILEKTPQQRLAK